MSTLLKKANISVLECSNKNVLSVGFIYKAVSWLDTVTIISMISITIDNTLWWFTFQQVNNPNNTFIKSIQKANITVTKVTISSVH